MGALTLAANAVLMTLFMVAGFGLDGFANAAEQIVGRAVGARFRPAFDAALKRIALWSFGWPWSWARRSSPSAAR